METKALETHSASWENAQELSDLTSMTKKEARTHLFQNPKALSEARATAQGSAPLEEAPIQTDIKAKSNKTAPPDIESLEQEVCSKHPQVIPGSLTIHTEGSYAQKRTVEIRCAGQECGNTRTVATSDLFQVKKCGSCVRQERLTRRRDRYASLKAQGGPG